MSGMSNLSNHDLLDIYKKAEELKLEKTFVDLISAEINRRNIRVKIDKNIGLEKCK